MFFFKKYKDQYLRLFFLYSEVFYKVLKFLYLRIVKAMPFKNKTALHQKIHNLCVLTGKSTAITRKYRLSGISLRTLMGFKFFFCLQKAS